MANARVELERESGLAPGPVWTDDAGAYRFEGVIPGEYRIRASMAYAASRMMARGPSEAWSVDPLSVAYYPGVGNPDLAARVGLIAGAGLSGLDFALPPSSPLRITGRLENAHGFGNETSGSYTFYLVPRDTATGAPEPIGPLPDHDTDRDTFELRNVPAGAWTLYMVFHPSSEDGWKWPPHLGRSVVNVVDTDVTGIVVPIEPNTHIEGRVVLHESAQGIDVTAIRPDLINDVPVPDTARLNPRLQVRRFVEPDGNFQITDVPQGPYRVTIMEHTLPDGVYLESARMNGANVFGVPMIINAASNGPLELELRGDGGRFEGRVVDAEEGGVGGARVVLVPPADRMNDPMAYLSARTNGSGNFTIEGIRPGGYTAIAFGEGARPERWQDAAVLAPFMTRGLRLDIDSGDRVREDIEIIPGR